MGRIIPGDSARMGEVLRDLLSDPDLLIAMGKRGAQLAASEYSWESIAWRMESLYQEAADSTEIKRQRRRHGQIDESA